MTRAARVYISSTVVDLREEREAVRRAILSVGHQPVRANERDTDIRVPLERAFDDVASSDACIVIVAWRYGWQPRDGWKSITELEWEAARNAGVPCLVFLKDEHRKAEIASDGAVELELLQKFRARLSESSIVWRFGSVLELESAVLAHLPKLLADAPSKPTSPSAESNSAPTTTVSSPPAPIARRRFPVRRPAWIAATIAVVTASFFALRSMSRANAAGSSAPRDADPLALPIAAATRALVRGAALDGVRKEKANFPHIDRFAWRERATVLTKDEVDRAWWSALERIAKNPRYADLRGELAPEFEQAPFSEARLAELERYLGFARDGRLIPLGPNRDAKSLGAPEPPEVDEGLEEFAVVGTGLIALRHPETGATRIAAGTAMVLVLIPADSMWSADAEPMQQTTSAQQPSTSPSYALTFLLAKTEMTESQRAIASGETPPASTPPNSPWVVQTWQHGVDVLDRLGMRLPTQVEWQHAAQAGEPIAKVGESFYERVAWYAANSGNNVHDVATREPNPFGLFDMLGNVAELCTDARSADSTDETKSWLDLTRVARGGRATDERVSPNSRLELVLEDRPQTSIGLRPAYDIRPPTPPATSAPPPQSAPSDANREETKQGAKKK